MRRQEDYRAGRRFGWTAVAVAGIVMAGGICAMGTARPAKPKPAAAKSKPAAAKTGRLTIVYTGDMQGQIRPCNCSRLRFGGYGREATAVADIRREAKDVVVIECGDFLGDPDTVQDQFKCDAAMQSMKAIGYNAVVVGDSELVFGASRLRSFQSTVGIPFLAANLQVVASRKPLFAKSYAIVKTASGLRVAIIGLVDPGLMVRGATQDSVVFAADPVATLKAVIPTLKGQADFVLVVAHTTYNRGKGLAKAPGVDALILAHRETEDLVVPEKGASYVESPVETADKCLLVKSHTRNGWSLGRLDIDIRPGGVKKAKNRLFYLNGAMKESPAIAKIYADYNKKVRDHETVERRRVKDKILAQLVKKGLDPSNYTRPKTFATSEGCKSCHEQAYNTWQKTGHSGAFASLKKTDQVYDPECVACHTTGGFSRGGFTDAKTTPDLGDVQCEACHGPGASHAANPGKGYGATGEESCRSCHTEDYGPDFNYDVMWKKIAH